jgi:hypothetical protein
MLNETGEFGQAENTPGRQIADVRDAGERKQMVLADCAERYLARDHQLVTSFGVLERRQAQRSWLEQLCVCSRHPARRVAQPVRTEVDAKRCQEIGGGLFGGDHVHAWTSPVGDDVGRRRRVGRARRGKGQLVSHGAPSVPELGS